MAKAEKVVELLERAFELMAEDDPIQPTIKNLYAALNEAEARLAVLEDWYRRTYALRGRIVIGEHDDQAVDRVRKEGAQANGEDE